MGNIQEPVSLIGCVVCGARWVQSDCHPPSHCGCGSSSAVLESGLVGEAAQIVIKHGCRLGQGWDSHRHKRHRY